MFPIKNNTNELLQRVYNKRNPNRKSGMMRKKTEKDWKGQRVCHLLISKLRLMNKDLKPRHRKRPEVPSSSRSHIRLDQNITYSRRSVHNRIIVLRYDTNLYEQSRFYTG